MRTIIRLFLALALIGVAAPAGAQTLTTVRVASPAVSVTGNLFYAIDLGYFKDAGLDVQVTQLPSGSSVTAAVIGNAVDIGSSNLLPIAEAFQNGAPLVLVAPSGGNSVKSPIDAIVVPANSTIKTASDLNGKTMVTSALLNILQIQVSAWIDKHGGDWKSVKWVEAPPPQEGVFISSGRADAGTITDPFLSAAVATGDNKILAYTGSEVAPLVIEGGYFCTKDYAAANAAVISKFTAAILKAGRWANTHHDEAFAIMQKYSKQMASKTLGLAVYPESFHSKDLQSLLDAALAYGALKGPVKAADLVAPDLR
jgi:NitT/TauT family transport system substrate-binding protein